MTLTSFFAAFQQSRRRRAAIRDLKRLSDEQLLDVGIEPDRLTEVADAMLWAQSRRQPTARYALRPERALASESRWRMV